MPRWARTGKSGGHGLWTRARSKRCRPRSTLPRRAAGGDDHAEGGGLDRRGRELQGRHEQGAGRSGPASRDRRQRPAGLLGRHAARSPGCLRRGHALRGRHGARDSRCAGHVYAEGDLDFRGTLGVAKDAPVGFTNIRLRFELDADASADQLATLQKLTERWRVYQTLRGTPTSRCG